MIALLLLSICLSQVLSDSPSPTPSPSTDTAIKNIWNYQIEQKLKATVAYKIWNLGIWEETGSTLNSTRDSRYYVTPPVTFIAGSAKCQYVPIMQIYDVVYDVQLWERELPRAVVEELSKMGINVREDQITPLPFYQARIVWNKPEQLRGLKLSPTWINNLQQQKIYSFHVTADNNASCQLLVDTLRNNPHQFIDFIQLQFTVSAEKIDTKVVTVNSKHIIGSKLASSLKNLPGADGVFRCLSSKDYNQMLLQITNSVVASETTSGDYIDADDELSLKDTVASMLNAQQVDVADFNERMWNSTFWDPLDERPDRVTREMNKFFHFNETEGRWYATQSSAMSTSASVTAIFPWFGVGASGSYSSNKSATTDQMQHLLEQNDIESEIDGDKFIPKKLDLYRLNVNDLNRDDSVSSNRVRLRQVDIGGVLQVGLANSTLGETDDENRYLRQQITDMQAMEVAIQQQVITYKAQLEEKLGNLEQHVNEDRNASQTGQNSLKQTLSNLTNRLSSVSSNPNANCKYYATDFNTNGGGHLAFFDHHDIRCPDGQVMTRWHLQNTPSSQFRIEYTCCTLA